MFCSYMTCMNIMDPQQTVNDEMVAQAHIENIALKLFNYADNEDRAKHYAKYFLKSLNIVYFRIVFYQFF